MTATGRLDEGGREDKVEEEEEPREDEMETEREGGRW
jgi:hypothetical protein